MAINNKSIVFSMFALFLGMLLISFSYIIIDNKIYSLNNNYYKYRLEYVNSEIDFFNNGYLKQIIELSSYVCLDSLVNYYGNNLIVLNNLDQNYSNFNKDFKECLYNGSVDGFLLNSMINKSLSYYIEIFTNNSKNNNLIHFNFTLYNLTIEDSLPYYVNVKIKYNLKVIPLDNLSKWDLNKTKEYNINIYEITEPLHLYYRNPNNYFPKIRGKQFYSYSSNWSLNSFNEMMADSFSYVYKEQNTEMTLGRSFLSRLTNISPNNFKNVVSYWPFDYDISKSYVQRLLFGDLNETIIWDLTWAKENENYGSLFYGKYYGNTLLLLLLNNETYHGSKQIDITPYRNDATIVNAIFKSSSCLSGECYEFDNNSFSKIEIVGFSTKNLENFTYSVWFKSYNVSKNFSIILGNEMGNNIWAGLVIKNKKLAFHNYEINNIDFYSDNDKFNLSSNSWYNAILVKKGDNFKIYQDGELIKEFNYSLNNSYPGNNFYIGGSKLNGERFFSGMIDEVAIYDKALTIEEIKTVYENFKGTFIDYKGSKFGLGVEFDGKDDFINISYNQSKINFNNPFSISFWFKPYINKSFNLLTYKTELEIGYNSSSNKICVGDNNGNNKCVNYNLVPNKYYYLVITKDSFNVYFYVNGRYLGSKNIIFNSQNDGGGFSIGSGNYPNNGISGKFFKGLIDEIRIYNKTLTSKEINNFYLNYNGFVRGHSNYLNIINQNKFGFNSSSYSDKVSSADFLFYKHYYLNKDYNYDLYNVSDLTSNEYDKNYYNLLLDICLIESTNIRKWRDASNNITNVTGINNKGCYELFYKGIY